VLLRAAVAALVLVSLAAVAGSGAPPVGATSTPDLIDVLQEAGTGSTSAAGSILPMLANGTLGAPIALPTATSGSQHSISFAPSAQSDGNLELSPDGNYLTAAGYAVAPGQASVTGTASATVPRVIARIDGGRDVDTSTALTTPFSGNNFRGAVTDGTHLWGSGAGSSNAGVVVTTLGSPASTGVSTGTSNARAVVIAGGNLYYSSAKTSPTGIWELNAGGGLPTGAATSTLVASNSDPYGFVLLHTASTGSAIDTLYVANMTNEAVYK
jgi:hypothetical protein